MSASLDGPLPPDAVTLIADYYRYSDLAEQLRELPEVAQSIGIRDVSPEYLTVLRRLEDQVLDRLTRLDAIGLYPTTATDEVTFNGIPVELPELRREPSPTLPLTKSATTESEESMETMMHDHEREGRSNGFDPAVAGETGIPTFIQRYVRPYLGYVATFTVGAVCGVLGARVLGGTSTDLTA